MPYVICYDTICAGFQAVCDDDGKPFVYTTKRLAEQELSSDKEFYNDCFVCNEKEIGHKTIFTGTKE